MVQAIKRCLSCRAALHLECLVLGELEEGVGCCCEIDRAPSISDNEGGRDLKDPLSTGRKQAARLYPIQEGMLCEWSGLANAGGGVFPIIGCNGTILEPAKGSGAETGNIHHGPDKNVLNNTDDNISRICTVCHNRWHGLNDKFYGDRPDYTMSFVPTIGKYLPLDKVTKATEEQIVANEGYWKIPDRLRKNINYTAVVNNGGLYRDLEY